jgi:hypothetical protein
MLQAGACNSIGYQMRNDKFCKYKGGGLNFGSNTWDKKLPLRFCPLSFESVKIPVGPSALGRTIQHEPRVISGNSNGLVDCKLQGLSGTPEQQPIGDRICLSAAGCMWVGPGWQQHFIPQPPEPIAPAANRLPPRTRTRAVHTAFSRIDLMPVEILFIVISIQDATLCCQW